MAAPSVLMHECVVCAGKSPLPLRAGGLTADSLPTLALSIISKTLPTTLNVAWWEQLETACGLAVWLLGPVLGPMAKTVLTGLLGGRFIKGSVVRPGVGKKM